MSCGAIIMLAYALSDDKFRFYSPWAFMLGSGYFHWRTAAFVGPVPWFHAATFIVIAALLTTIAIEVIQQRDF